MKKFIFIVAALAMSMFAANAQTTVQGSKTFDNVYVGVEGGVLTPLAKGSSFFQDMRPAVGIEVGKNITPVVGFSVEALGAINTTPSATAFDQSNLRANLKVNLSNWFGGYKGEPRKVEVSLVPGMGWGHDYVAGGDGYNYLTYNGYAQVDFNLGQAKAWQINIKPGITAAARNGSYGIHRSLAVGQLTAGITYKFGNKRTKSHNFVACPYTVTKADYDAALAQIEALKGRKPETVEVVKEVPVEKVVEKTVDVTKPGSTIITFDMGSATLKAVEMAKVKAYAAQLPEGASVKVTGSADLGTGSRARNENLATRRAEVVASALKDAGVKNVETATAFDTNEVAEASRAAIVLAD